MQQPLLSLCMIVKNEEDNLPRCLKSVVGVVDEIIIVDTGSSDKTVKIAESFGAKIYHLPWQDNFSAPRNLSLDKAQGKWVLILDADEELAEETKTAIRPSLLNDTVEGFNWKLKNFFDGSPPTYEMGLTLRVFRNNSLYRYDGSIHEQIYPVILNITPTAIFKSEDILINHYGYLGEQIKKKGKKKRNMRIYNKKASEACAKGNYANDNFFHFNMGMELFRLHKFKKAYAHFIEAEKDLPVNSSFGPKLVRYITYCLASLKRYSEALKKINYYLTIYPDYVDLYFLRGYIFYLQKKYGQAIFNFCYCLDLKDVPEWYGPINGLNGFRSYHYLSQIFEALEDYQQALLACKEALKDEPKFTEILHKIVSILKENKYSANEIEDTLKQSFNFDNSSGDILLWNVFFNGGFYKKSMQYLRKAPKKGNSLGLGYSKAMTLLKLKKFEEALEIFKALPLTDPTLSGPIIVNHCLCLWLIDDLEQSISLLQELPNLKINPYIKKTYPNFQKLLEGKEVTLPKVSLKRVPVYNKTVFDLIEALVEAAQFDKAHLALKLLIPQKDLDETINFAALLIKHRYLKEAEQYLNKHKDQVTFKDKVYSLLGEIELKKSNLKKAKELYEKAANLNPKKEKYYLKLGYLLQQESLLVLKEGLKKHPTFSPLRNALPEIDIFGGLRF